MGYSRKTFVIFAMLIEVVIAAWSFADQNHLALLVATCALLILGFVLNFAED